MPIERKTRKIVILFAILGVLVIGRLVMFFGWEYGAPKIGIPPTKYVTPTEESPEETVKNGLLTGYYRRTVSLPLNKKVDVGYLVPLGPDGKPRPGAENMIFYAIPSGAANRKPGSQPWLQPLAREFNCTVFTLAIRSNLNITEDRRQYYIYREAGWFDVVFDIQEKLAKRFGLPHRKLLLMGESSGGSMVQRIAAAFPDRVAAAAWCGGSRYDLERLKKRRHSPPGGEYLGMSRGNDFRNVCRTGARGGQSRAFRPDAAGSGRQQMVSPRSGTGNLPAASDISRRHGGTARSQPRPPAGAGTGDGVSSLSAFCGNLARPSAAEAFP